MDADGLPLVGPGLDYTKIEAINQKRIIAFVNHFLSHTVQFLNHFAVVCEEKLSDINVKIQRLEAITCILETKLSYIPGLESVTAPSTATSQPINTSAPTATESQAYSQPPTNDEQTTEQPAAEEIKPEMTISQDPRYAKFFKLMKMGVPLGAAKQKATLEGLNPDLLDTPDAPAPTGSIPPPGSQIVDDDADLSDQSDSASDEEW